MNDGHHPLFEPAQRRRRARSDFRRGDLLATVRTLVESLEPGTVFSSRWILHGVRARFPDATIRDSSVSNALRAQCRPGLCRLAERGGSNSPAVYQRL